MAIFGFGKDKKETGNSSEQVLAYLEDAQRTRAPFTLIGPRKAETTGTIQSLEEGDGQITFQVAPLLATEKGTTLQFIFYQDGMRIGGSGKVADLRSNLVVMALPDALELKERRSQPRARVNPKEGSTLTALTGIFEGVGITGVVESLSESGARVRVEKAMNLKGEKRLPLGTALVAPGQPFMLIKLNKAPKCPPVMELEGRAAFLETSAGSLTLGLAFEKPKADLASALRSLVASRTTPMPSVLPPKNRRRTETAPAEPAQEAVPEPPRPAPPMPAPAPPAPPAEVPQAAPAPTKTPEPAAPAPEPQAPKNEALLRMKKRSRAVVALAPTPAFVDILKDHLQEEGFGRALVTTSRKELLEFLQQPNLAVLLIDGDYSTLEALQFVAELKGSFPALPPIILAVEEVSTGIVLAAHRHGVTQMLVKPYALDDAFSDLLSQQL